MQNQLTVFRTLIVISIVLSLVGGFIARLAQSGIGKPSTERSPS